MNTVTIRKPHYGMVYLRPGVQKEGTVPTERDGMLVIELNDGINPETVEFYETIAIYPEMGYYHKTPTAPGQFGGMTKFHGRHECPDWRCVNYWRGLQQM